MSTSTPGSQDFQAISFPEWKGSLAAAPLAPEVRERYRRAILTLLKVCKQRRAPVSVGLIRAHLAEASNATAAAALRWFWTAARDARRAESEGMAGVKPAPQVRVKAEISVAGESTGRMPVPRPDANTGEPLAAVGKPPIRERTRASAPPVAAGDQGGAGWERALIAASRSRGFLWRTEETYRMWGAQFARFLTPQEPDAAGAAEVAAFLSELAVTRRVSPSTQKQAA